MVMYTTGSYLSCTSDSLSVMILITLILFMGDSSHIATRGTTDNCAVNMYRAHRATRAISTMH